MTDNKEMTEELDIEKVNKKVKEFEDLVEEIGEKLREIEDNHEYEHVLDAVIRNIIYKVTNPGNKDAKCIPSTVSTLGLSHDVVTSQLLDTNHNTVKTPVEDIEYIN